MNESELQDQVFQCKDCGRDFTFSIGEQRFFQSKGLSTPLRCSECRMKRRIRLVPDEGGGRR